MEVIRKLMGYLVFRKEDTKGNTNLKLMHGINRISILLFLVAMIVLVLRLTA